MPKDPNIDFVSIIKEVFSSVFNDYGFVLNDKASWDGRGENTIKASKGDVDINFYIGVSQLFYYCSAGIKLSGETGEKATPHVKYRSMGISAIAKGMDSNYKSSNRAAQTAEEVKKAFEAERDDMVRYCKNILLGDVSSWTPVAHQLAEEWKIKQNSVSNNQKTEDKPSNIMAGLSKLFGKK